jgi:cytochrome P450
MSPSSPTTKSAPSVKGWPLIGNTPAFLKDPIKLLVHAYQELGPIFKIKLLNQSITMIGGLEGNLFLAQHANELLSTKETWGSFKEVLNAESLLVALDGKPHAAVRKAMARGYSPQMITHRIPKVVTLTEEMLRDRCEEDLPVVQYVQRLITEQIGLLLVNRAPGADFDHLSWFIRVSLNTSLLKVWPRLMLRHPRFLAAQKRMGELSEAIIQEHRAAPNPEFPDLIDDILEAYDKGTTPLQAEDLVFCVVGPFFAGMDTITNTVSMCLYALKQHPDIFAQLREEVDQVWEHGTPTTQLFQQLPLLHGFILETLRRYPVTPMIPRTAIKDFEFEGCQVRQGDTVYMAQSITHFLPDLFPDPYAFDISRYEAPRNEHRQRGAFSPYGIGAHKCLGARLGEIQMMLTIATVIRTIDYEIVPKDYQLKMRTLPTLGPEPKFQIRMRARQ